MHYFNSIRLLLCWILMSTYLSSYNNIVRGFLFSPSPWLRIPEGTKWAMTHAFTIPFSKLTEITVNIPVTYTFDNTSRFTLSSNTVEARSLSDEQLDLFGTIEKTLQSVGLDGKACLLRAICEISESPIRDLTLIGDILMLILKPRHRLESRSFLYDYYKAEDIGRRRGKCWQIYYTCPLSIKYLLAGLRYRG